MQHCNAASAEHGCMTVSAVASVFAGARDKTNYKLSMSNRRLCACSMSVNPPCVGHLSRESGPKPKICAVVMPNVAQAVASPQRYTCLLLLHSSCSFMKHCLHALKSVDHRDGTRARGKAAHAEQVSDNPTCLQIGAATLRLGASCNRAPRISGTDAASPDEEGVRSGVRCAGCSVARSRCCSPASVMASPPLRWRCCASSG